MGWGGHPQKRSEATPKSSFFPPKPPLRKVKALGEEEPWLDDAAAWIERSRRLQQEKELAEKRVGEGKISGGVPLPPRRYGVGEPKTATALGGKS